MRYASPSRFPEGKDALVDLRAQVTTAELTPREAPRDINAQRMRLHEWVADQRNFQYAVKALSLDMASETWTYS